MGTFRKAPIKAKLNQDGWVTMSGLHVLIDDATGKIMSGPLKGQQHKAVLQTKKQKSEAKKQAKKAEKQSKGLQKAVNNNDTEAIKKALGKVKVGDYVDVGVYGAVYKKTAKGWVQPNGDPIPEQTIANNAVYTKNANVKQGYTSKAISNKLDNLPEGTTLTAGAVEMTKQANGHWTDQYGNLDFPPEKMAQATKKYADSYGADSCKISKPDPNKKHEAKQKQEPTQNSSESNTSLTQTLQSNAKTMKLKDFKQSMKDGMEAAKTGTKVDWGGKTYIKQADGSWNYVSEDGKTHKTSAKNVAHLATLKGADNQAPTKKTKATLTEGGTISDKAGYDAALKAHKAKEQDYNTDTTQGHEKSPYSAEDIQKQCGVDFEKALDMQRAVYGFSTDWYKPMKKAVTSTKEEYEQWQKDNFCKDKSYDEACRKANFAEEFITKSPKVTGQIMRGEPMGPDDFNELMNKVKNKKPIQSHGLSSWSTKEGKAQDFAGGGKFHVVHVLKNGTTQGTSMKNISFFEHEEEVLVSGDEKRIATGNYWEKTVMGTTYTYIEEEEVLD